MDRRTVLKGAVATGWIAPLIVSAPAAAAACTIKCAFNVTGAATGAGATIIAVRTQSISSCAALLTFETPANNCPCDAARSVISWGTVGTWSNGVTVGTPIPTGSTTFELPLTNIAAGTTAVTHAQVVPTQVRVTCLDRQGRSVTRECAVSISFTAIKDNNGANCNGFVATFGTPTLGACTTFCP